jgi:hypothetical protein
MYVTGIYKNIFCCQSHPEFDYEYAIKDRIWKHVVEKNNRLSEAEILVAMESFEDYTSKDSKILLTMIKSFLHIEDGRI